MCQPVRMPVSRLLGVCAGLLFLSACRDQCQVMAQNTDMSPEMASSYGAALHPPYSTLSETQGSGRVARPGERFQIALTLLDQKGDTLFADTLSLEYPPAKEQYRGPRISRFPFPGAYPAELGSSVCGMREGGERELAVSSWSQIPAPHSEKAIQGLDFKPFFKVTEEVQRMRVKLLKVCEPRYCLRTSYSIPSMRSQKLILKSCS